MDRFRYSRQDQFVYQIMVPFQPKSQQARSRSLYKQNIQNIAKRRIDSIIRSNDIEIEITWTSTIKEEIRSDIDNIIKPIIDALKGVAYEDDKQIRSLVVTYFNKNLQHSINCYVEDLKEALYSGHDNVVLVTIYSDSKLIEKGGPEVVRKHFLDEKLGPIMDAPLEKIEAEQLPLQLKSHEKLIQPEPLEKFVDVKNRKYYIEDDIKGLYVFWYNNHDQKAIGLNRAYSVAGPNGMLEQITWDWNLEKDRICLYIGKSTNIKKRISLHLLLGTKRLYDGDETMLKKKTTACQLRSGFEYLYLRNNVDLFEEIQDRIELSYTVEPDFIKRFFYEDMLIGSWRPWFNVDSER